MMLRPFGGDGPVSHNFQVVATQCKTLATQTITAARHESLNAIGVRVLSWGQQDFFEKSRGGSAGGVSWRPIQPGTVAARARRLKSYTRLGKGARRKRLAVFVAGAKIGIDTGRLVASLKAGRNADQIFDVTDTAVIVGARVTTAKGGNYAAYFDAVRPIFGPNFIDGKRLEELERLAARVYERACKQLEGGK